VEASKVVSGEEAAPAHDAYTRLLQRIPPDSQALWQEIEALVVKAKGVLVIDDTTLDKPYAEKMAMVSCHWSGKHHRVVMDINLISLLWTDGEAHLPCDFRFYNPSQDGLTKNDHFQNMLKAAQEHGFTLELVAFDSWYSSLENLKLVRGYGWHWLTQLKKNRLLSLDRSGNRPVSDWLIPSHGQKCT
jgi:putative transposase